MITYDQTIMLSMFNICMFDNVDRVAFDYRIYQQSSYITGVDVCLTVILIAPQAMLTTLINPYTPTIILHMQRNCVAEGNALGDPPRDHQSTTRRLPEDHQMATRGPPDDHQRITGCTNKTMNISF